MATDIKDVRYLTAVATRVLAKVGLATGILTSMGHASIRVPNQPDQFVVKGRGYEVDSLAVMQPEDMVVCNMNGSKVEGPKGVTPPNEVKMHSCIYNARPDVQAVVHVHPSFVVVMSVLRARLAPMIVHGAALVRNGLPIYPSPALITTEESGVAVAGLLNGGKAVVLRGHGAATVGASVGEAISDMMELEEQAKLNWYAYCAAGPNYEGLSGDLLDEFNATIANLRNLEHLKDADGETGRPRTSGTYDYYSMLAAGEM
ncbi:MAG: L-fuculose-phosphate aldolase [Chloroflexi bacterium]|jgi:ribulose-5-phosphate 4-epimerase/fuculose-1-phosphate aldolase|nr:MAG: L-fuculose-phosphate aldolase [Chloroflexota bacterium]